MIRFNLTSMVRLLEMKEHRRITLKEIAERSGCDKNALSRLRSSPHIIPSANVIDKLVQFFFNELKGDDASKHQKIMKSIIQNFVCVFPDDQRYWNPIPKGIQENPSVSLDDLWEIYTTTHEKGLA